MGECSVTSDGWILSIFIVQARNLILYLNMNLNLNERKPVIAINEPIHETLAMVVFSAHLFHKNGSVILSFMNSYYYVFPHMKIIRSLRTILLHEATLSNDMQ